VCVCENSRLYHIFCLKCLFVWHAVPIECGSIHTARVRVRVRVSFGNENSYNYAYSPIQSCPHPKLQLCTPVPLNRYCIVHAYEQTRHMSCLFVCPLLSVFLVFISFFYSVFLCSAWVVNKHLNIQLKSSITNIVMAYLNLKPTSPPDFF